MRRRFEFRDPELVEVGTHNDAAVSRAEAVEQFAGRHAVAQQLAGVDADGPDVGTDDLHGPTDAFHHVERVDQVRGADAEGGRCASNASSSSA